MPSLGPAEILVVLVIALLVFGPDKMPDMARQAGRAFREFRRVQQHLRSELSGALSDIDPTGSVPTPGTSPSTTTPGGDPVPMLDPLDPAARQPDAVPPPGATGPVPGLASPVTGANAAASDGTTSAQPTAETPPSAPDPGSGTAPADPA